MRREEALDELGAAVELGAARHEHGNQPLVEGALLRQALDEPHEEERRAHVAERALGEAELVARVLWPNSLELFHKIISLVRRH